MREIFKEHSEETFCDTFLEYLLENHLCWNLPGQKAGVFALPDDRVSSNENDHDEGDEADHGEWDDDGNEGNDMCRHQ